MGANEDYGRGDVPGACEGAQTCAEVARLGMGPVCSLYTLIIATQDVGGRVRSNRFDP